MARNARTPLFLALLSAVFVVAAPRPGAAQVTGCVTLDPPCTNVDPFVTLSPPAAWSTSPYVQVNVRAEDESGLQASTFAATLNGVLVQSGAPAAGTLLSVDLALSLAPGENVLVVSVCDQTGLCTAADGRYTYAVPPPADSFTVPVLNLAPYSEGVRTVSPFDAVAAYSTPAYVSMDQPRAVTLVYTGAQAQARAYLQLDAVDGSGVAPSRMSIQVYDAAGAAATAESFYRAGTGANRLAAHWLAPSLQTGAHTYQVVVRSYWDLPGRTVTRVAPPRPVRVLILNEQSSRFGHGWSMAGLQRVHPRGDSAMVANGDGTAVFFTRTGATTFAKPDGEWSELAVQDSLWVRSWPDGTKAVFSANGRLKSVRDRFDRVATYGYDATGRLSAIVDPAGLTVAIGYHGSYTIASVTTPGGRTSQFGYDGNRVTRIWDPDGVVALYMTYRPDLRMATRTDRDGATAGFAYDPAGFLAADTLPAVAVEGGGTQRPVIRYAGWESAFLPAPGAGTASNPAPRVDTAAVRARVTGPRGASTATKLDRFLLPTRVEEPLGDTTVVVRNRHGQPTTVIHPTGAFAFYQYDGPNLSSASEYRALGEPVELRTEIEYKQPFSLPEVVTVGGMRTVNGYGANGELKSTAVLGDTTTYAYTADWRLRSVTAPGGHVTTFAYDTTGFRNLREARDTDANGQVRTVTRASDAYGRTASTTDAAGTVLFRYDLLNRDTAVTDPSGTTRSAYQGSFLHRVTDAAGKAYVFHRNPLGWVTSQVDPDGRATGYGYDVAGNAVRVTDRRGRSVFFTHDSLGRVLTRVAGADTTVYAYGPRGRWVSAANAVSVDTLRFDPLGRKTEEKTVFRAWPDSAFVRASYWEPEGPRRSLVYQVPGRTGQELRFEYDGALRLIGLVAWNQRTTTAFHGAGAADTILVRAGGPRAITENTVNGLPRQERWNVPALDLALGRQYGWDALDRQILRANAAGSSERRYYYDALSRLTAFRQRTQAQGSTLVCEDPMQPQSCSYPMVWIDGDTMTYAYDAVGNRADAGAALQPNSNRYQTFRGYTFEYDLEGNVTRKHNSAIDQTLVWNDLGQLASVTTTTLGPPATSVTVAYAYNGFGQRVRRTAGASSTYSVYDGDDLLLELNGSGAMVREYAHYPGVDHPHSMRDPVGNVYYYGMEYPGHVSGLFNTANQVVNQYAYSPWGEMDAVTENVPQPFRYMGRELDLLTGLYYVRNRWYDPVAARFVSEDPIGLAGGINVYAYVGNSPTNFLDPLGLDPQTENGDDACAKLAEQIEDARAREVFLNACKLMKGKTFAIERIYASAKRPVRKLYNSGWSFGDLSMTLYTGLWYFAPAKITAGAANEFVAENFPDADPRTQNNALHLFGACYLAKNFGRSYAEWITTGHETFLLPRNRRRENQVGSDSWHDQMNNRVGIEAGMNGADCDGVAMALARF